MVIEYSLKFFYTFNDISHLETLSPKKNCFKIIKFVLYFFLKIIKAKVISSALTRFLGSVKRRWIRQLIPQGLYRKTSEPRRKQWVLELKCFSYKNSNNYNGNFLVFYPLLTLGILAYLVIVCFNLSSIFLNLCDISILLKYSNLLTD